MKLPSFRRSDAHKPRPYWHVDAKWVCAILLGAALAVTLPVAAAHRLTAREHATELLAYTMAGLTSPNGIDDAEGLDEVKERVKDFETLSPRELRLKVFSAFAERLYDQGARRLAEAQGLDKAAVDKAVKDASMLNLFSQETHKRVGTILVWLFLLDLLLLAALVFFSNRFGRLVSPGLVMLLVGLPGLLFWAIASQNPEVAGAARSEDPESNLAALNLFASYVGPLIVPHFAAAYLFALRIGLLLLGLAITGRIVYSVIKHRTKAHEHKSTEAETNDKKITS
jgi:hypothetical protein